MSRQAENFERLCRGGSLPAVTRALNLVHNSVREELSKKYGVAGEQLAHKLIVGL
ncbi:MAG: hypothetical protein HUJ71_05375 [Pseudobutyrivibrio sp.]|nr:hypothetical protein [Pseudobutyrivibrio sp.]